MARRRLRLHALEIPAVSLLIVLYTLAAILVSLHRFWQFDAFWLDFGILDETIWKWSRFSLPIITNVSPPQGRIVWADHFNPSLISLAPLYWITSRAEIMLIAQVISVSLSAVVAYVITRKLVKSPIVRVAMTVSFLGFVGLQNALYTDIHNVVFALLPFMLTLWSFYNQKWRLYWSFLLLTLGVQENMAAVVVGLGLFFLMRKPRSIKLGINTILVSLLWGLASIYLIIPYFNGGSYNYVPSFPHVWQDWFIRFIEPPAMKLFTIVMTYLTFGLLPLLSLATLPLIIWHFMERFVLNEAATRWDLGFHYNALLSPIMFLATLEVILLLQKKLVFKKWLSIWGFVTIIIVLFLHRFYLHGPLLLAHHPVFYAQTKRAQFLRDFVAQIPPAHLLMTQNNLAAHFTHHNVMLLNRNWETIRPDVIALDARPGQNANDFFPFTPLQFENLVASLSANPNYEKIAITDSEHIFKIK